MILRLGLALQLIGTNALRDNFNNKIFILSQKRRLSISKDKKIVVADCRFQNEIDLIHEFGGLVMQITRGRKPEWYDMAAEANKTNNQLLKDSLWKDYGIHASERDWIEYNIDYIITNNGTFQDLYDKLDEILDSVDQ